MAATASPFSTKRRDILIHFAERIITKKPVRKGRYRFMECGFKNLPTDVLRALVEALIEDGETGYLTSGRWIGYWERFRLMPK
jgi:hypothetical protein